MSRCDSCPVPPHLPCRGESIPHKCGDARYRAYFANLATGRDDPIPARVATARPSPAAALALAARARRCRHREPCDCQHVDCAFFGARRPARDCLDCPHLEERPAPDAWVEST